jgi:site-specific DNA-methyltransferase (adenine-specific)
MSVHYADATVTLHHGDCLDVLRSLPDASVDSVVCDPPYGLEFMGKEWDGADGFRRSLNPNDVGRDNAFGRTSRTSPEYRTGRGARVLTERADELTERGRGHSTSAGPYLASGVDSVRVAGRPFQEWCEAWSRECLRVLKPGGHLLAFGGSRTWHRLAAAVEDAGFEIRDSIAWLYGSGFPKSLNLTDEEGERTGWGTALKPAFEPVVVARKPLVGTVAANVLEHGTGALNIDGCRIDYTSETDKASARPGGKLTSLNGALAGKAQTCETTTTAAPTMASSTTSENGSAPSATSSSSPRTEFRTEQGAGRWPANVVLDESQAEALDEQSGERPASGSAKNGTRSEATPDSIFGGPRSQGTLHNDSGGASRFFYVAKADASERPRVNGTAHPTVKPLDLMRWLVRLVTPPGGTVLEPFAGSGTTVEACIVEGFHCIAIEREADYLPLIEARIARRRDPVKAITLAGDDLGLFGEATA